jgi:hypothetical protein
MASFLATLSAAASGNWEICKRHGMWGTGTSRTAQRAAEQVRAGDAIYVWQSGKGLIAKATARSSAREATLAEVPWPDPGRYSYIFDIDVVGELPEPVADRFKEYRSIRFGLRSHELQSGFIRIDVATAARLDDAVAGIAAVSSTPTARDDRVVEQREGTDARPSGQLCGVYLRPASSVTEVLLALYRRVGGDDHGELFVVGDERHRAEVEHELSEEPFSAMRGRLRFVTGEQLAAEVSHRFAARRETGRP